jgi:hypothetical protein
MFRVAELGRREQEPSFFTVIMLVDQPVSGNYLVRLEEHGDLSYRRQSTWEFLAYFVSARVTDIATSSTATTCEATATTRKFPRVLLPR